MLTVTMLAEVLKMIDPTKGSREMQTQSLTKVPHTGIHHNQTLDLITTTQLEVVEVITIQEEVTARHDLIPQAVAVPQAIVQDQESPAVEVEAVLEADN